MTLDDLTAFGANTEDGIKRCVNNGDFYLRLVKMIPNDPSFQKLYDALGSGDLKAAFEAAHALKGSVGNLSLTPIFEPLCEITELLRAQTDTDYAPFMEKIRNAQDALARICSE